MSHAYSKEQMREYNRTYYLENRERLLTQKKQDRVENLERYKEREKAYSQLPTTKARANAYLKAKSLVNPFYNLHSRVSKSVRRTLKSLGTVKSRRTGEIVGCSDQELLAHLIQTFEQNYSVVWCDSYRDSVQIDHIYPISRAKTESDVVDLNHYSNLQLLWYDDNIIKSDHLEWSM